LVSLFFSNESLPVNKGKIMHLTRILQKRTSFFILLLIVAIIASFLGGMAHKYGIQRKIPLVSYVTSLLRERVGKSPFFYPAPKEDNPELFNIKDVEYPFTFLAMCIIMNDINTMG
jgi:hypothetical protein